MKTLFDILSSKDSIIIPLRCHANFTRGFHKSKTKDFNVRYRGGSIIPQHIHFYKGDNSIQRFKTDNMFGFCKIPKFRYFVEMQENYSIKSTNTSFKKFIKRDFINEDYRY